MSEADMQPRMMIVSGATGLMIAAAAAVLVWNGVARFDEHDFHRLSSSESVRNLVVAAHGYHGAYASFPVAATTASTPSALDLHGWQTLLLPELGVALLFSSIDLGSPWLDPRYEPHFRQTVSTFHNPALVALAGPTGLSLSHYSGNSQVLTAGSPLTLSDVTDGASNTIFAGEINAAFPPWGEPRNVRDPGAGVHTSPRSFGGPWPDRSTQFSFFDGRVRTINANIDPAVLKAMATPAGGEAVTPP